VNRVVERLSAIDLDEIARAANEEADVGKRSRDILEAAAVRLVIRHDGILAASSALRVRRSSGSARSIERRQPEIWPHRPRQRDDDQVVLG
jgi:hypothetical protein